jgi:serine/threonine protein kinase
MADSASTKSEMTEEHANALPKGFRIYEYQIQSILGSGGFGITYLAWDTNLEKDVAIKEYLPVEFAVRQGETSVRPRSKGDEDDYYWGLERFLKEAQTLAVFRHPSIVPVFRFFEAHGTAYMVMEYEKGESFATVMREKRGKFTEEELRALLMPLFDGLAEVHAAGYLHRDIKPGNIFIRRNGTPVLLDFGAARHAVGRKSQNLTSIVTPGYAPLEQYFADGNQGPWTDIYALASILYQAVTGVLPPEAPARVRNDPLTPASQAVKRGFSKEFLQAIDAGLAVAEEDRPQSIADWRAMFTGEAAPATVSRTAGGVPAGATVRLGGAGPEVTRRATGDGGKKGGALKWAIAAVVALLVIGGGVYGYVRWDEDRRIAADQEAKRQAAIRDDLARMAAAEEEAKRKAAADADAKRKAAAD